MKRNKPLSLSDYVPELRSSRDVQFDLCERFIARRKELNLSRQKLADLAKVNVGVIRRYEENGYIALNNLIDLAFAMQLGLEFDYLFSHPKIKGFYD